MENKIRRVASNFANPEDIMTQLEVEPGGSVADFGCGSGYFSIQFARLVGGEGKVYSLDVLPQALESVKSQAKMEALSNIETRRVNLENKKGSGLPDESVDWVIMKGILFQNKNKKALFEETYRILRAGGKALVMEWGDRDLSIGPDASIRMSQEDLESLITDQGLTIEKRINAGDFHYAIIVCK